MSETLLNVWWWIVTPPHFIWRVPVAILCALLGWALWMWLWDVFWPWARLILRVLGKMFEKVAEALEFIPRKSKETVAYLEHVMRLCACPGYGCPHRPKAESAR